MKAGDTVRVVKTSKPIPVRYIGRKAKVVAVYKSEDEVDVLVEFPDRKARMYLWAGEFTKIKGE